MIAPQANTEIASLQGDSQLEQVIWKTSPGDVLETCVLLRKPCTLLSKVTDRPQRALAIVKGKSMSDVDLNGIDRTDAPCRGSVP
jgi:hypothetical protein